MPALRGMCRIANAGKAENQKCSAKDRLVHDRIAGSGLTGLQATDGFNPSTHLFWTTIALIVNRDSQTVQVPIVT